MDQRLQYERSLALRLNKGMEDNDRLLVDKLFQLDNHARIHSSIVASGWNRDEYWAMVTFCEGHISSGDAIQILFGRMSMEEKRKQLQQGRVDVSGMEDLINVYSTCSPTR